jgi:hypothetical protein
MPPTPAPVDTPPTGYSLASIMGTVWRDDCAPGTEGQPGCATTAQGGGAANGMMDDGEPAIAGVQVTLGSGACPASGLATATTDGKGAFAFTGLNAGSYCVALDAGAAANSAVLAAGRWTAPAAGQALATFSVTLKAGEHRDGVGFGWGPQEPPAGTTDLSQGDGECTYRVAFVADVTIPDDSVLAPGESFAKTWRVLNDGTCTWGPNGYALNAFAFVGGDRLGAPDQVKLSGEVRPGNMVDLSVNMVAPPVVGTYTSNWMLRIQGAQADDPNAGTYLGLGYTGQYPFFARIAVAPVERIAFAQGATTAVVAGTVRAGQTRVYTLRALKDQVMFLTLAPAAGARLSAKGADGQVPVTVRAAADGGSRILLLPSTQDYLITLAAGQQDAPFTLAIDIPQRIIFAADESSATVNGATTQRRPLTYLLRARAGQTMSVRAQGANGAVVSLTIFGLQDGVSLVRGAGGGGDGGGVAAWSGVLPSTQDYVIQVTPATDSLAFTLSVTVR